MMSLLQIGDGSVEIGRRTRIGDGAKVVFDGPGKVFIGDYCSIGPGVKIVVTGGEVRIGDWTSLHDNCLVLSKAGVEIADHGWFGQNSVIDGTGGLSIGSGVRVGMYSQIWSHVAAGEQIEGCTLIGERGVRIEDSVWLVGSCIVASGLTLGERLVALIGSNITKSFPARTVIAGVPAVERPGLSFYREVHLDEKIKMIEVWLSDFASRHDALIERRPEEIRVRKAAEEVVFVWDEARASELADSLSVTICDLVSKRYTKRLTDLEAAVLKFLAGNKARFRAAI